MDPDYIRDASQVAPGVMADRFPLLAQLQLLLNQDNVHRDYREEENMEEGESERSYEGHLEIDKLEDYLDKQFEYVGLYWDEALEVQLHLSKYPVLPRYQEDAKQQHSHNGNAQVVQSLEGF